MHTSAQRTRPKTRPIRSLRWWIAGILFASTVINYVDRQTLSLLAPYLKVQYHWDNSDYANIVIAFRVAYVLGQAVFGRLLDRIGTRRGLTITVLWYSIVSTLTSAAQGFRSFIGFRFLLGLGESANWPAATKAVSEWFPKKERALATAFFDSGSSLGGAIAPFLILPIYFRWGWRPAFVIPGLLGFIWLIVWRTFYYPPEKHPRITPHELEYILADKNESGIQPENAAKPGWFDLLRFPQTWGTIVARLFTDPIWFFIADWFPIYLVAKGLELKSTLLVIWIPFIAADVGNFVGGFLSGHLIKRGWSLGAARKALVVFGGIGMMMLLPTIFTNNLYIIAGLFGFATMSYSAFSTMANVLPSDLFRSEYVASVSGLGGAAAGVGTIIASKLIGHFSDANQLSAGHSFDSIVIVAGLVPFVGMILVLLLVRNTKATAEGFVRPI
jgi:ACS family hexuronate transporter-like MFS transporter